MFHVKHIFQIARNQPIEYILFYIFLFTIPLQLRFIFNPGNAYIDYYFSYHKAIFFYLGDLFFVVFAVSYFLFNNQHKWSIWPVLLPVSWAFLSLFHVEQLTLGVYSAVKILEFWLIIGFIKLNPNIIKPGVWILIVGGFTQSVIGILQFHVQHGLNLAFLGEYVPPLLDNGTATISTIQGKVLRAYGTMPHPNVYAGFLAIILGFWLYVSCGTLKPKQWIIVSCGTFVLWWGLLVSFSRSGWLAAFLVTAMLIFYQIYRKSYKQAIIWGCITIVSCGTLTFAYKDLVFPRSTDVLPSSQAVTYRADFNAYGLETFKHNILGGVGAGQYITNLEKIRTLEPWQYQPAHNIFIYYLAELGIIGLLLSFFAIFKLGFTWNNLNLLCFMLIGAVLVLGMLDHYLITIQQGSLLLAVVIGIIITNKKDVSQL